MCEIIVFKFVCVVLRRRREEEEKPGIQNQKQEPHTKMWGTTHLSSWTCQVRQQLHLQLKQALERAARCCEWIEFQLAVPNSWMVSIREIHENRWMMIWG